MLENPEIVKIKTEISVIDEKLYEISKREIFNKRRSKVDEMQEQL